MSWKHTKLEDSATFRSLERVAQQKNLIKADPAVVKTASKGLDLSPSNNLSNNIIKLCSGLRARGMEKIAEELESKFINYKRAESLYETSKETGDDLIDSAHPDGSHKLEDVDGDATVETILDQHKKHLEVINKKPTGKLTTANQIIDAVKLSLGQYFDVEANLKAFESFSQSMDKLIAGLKSMEDIYSATKWSDTKSAISDKIKVANEIKADIAKVDPNLNPFPQSLNSRIGKLFFDTRTWADAAKAYFADKSNLEKDGLDAIFVNRFNSAYSTITYAQSLSWGAAKALSGDISGMEFHKEFLSADEVKSVISAELIRKLQAAKKKISDIKFNERKEKLSADKKTAAESAVTQIETLLSISYNALGAISKATDPSMGLINQKIIQSLFKSPFEWSTITDIDSLTKNCQNSAAKVLKNVSIIEEWLNSAGA